MVAVIVGPVRLQVLLASAPANLAVGSSEPGWLAQLGMLVVQVTFPSCLSVLLVPTRRACTARSGWIRGRMTRSACQCSSRRRTPVG